MRNTLIATALAAAFACTPVLAQSGGFLRDAGPMSRDASASTIVRDDAGLAEADAAAGMLQPGEFRWLEGAPANGEVLVVVNLAGQTATVFRDGHPLAVTTVSTGMAGRETTPGAYPILVKEKMHHSNRYDNAPMPFMQRLTWTGMALHAGRIPGYPASHGCVRLPKAFAEKLYTITKPGNMVVVADDASATALVRAGLQPAVALQVGASPRDLASGAPSMLASEAAGAPGSSALGAP